MAIHTQDNAPIDKATNGAFVFLVVFLLVHGLFDEKFKAKYRQMLTAFGILRLLLLTLFVHDATAG